MPGSRYERLYDDGDHWDGFDSYASGEFGDDEPSVNIPELTPAHNKAIVASSIGLLGLGLAAVTVATVKHVKRRKQGEQI